MKKLCILPPYAQAFGGTTFEDLVASEIADSITVAYDVGDAAITFGPPTGGTEPYSIDAVMVLEEDGTIITATEVSAGNYTFPAEPGKAYMATAQWSDGSGQVTYSSKIIYCEEVPALSWVAPAAISVATGTTSTTITWPAATGGLAPYTYSATTAKYDSAGTYSFTLSDASLVTTIGAMANGSTYVVQRTVTDAEGTSITVQAAVVVGAAVAAITAGTAPANQTLAAGTLSATIGTWGSSSGGTGPYTYALTEPTGHGASITGSGLGSYSATGLTNGRTYGFLLEITDSLGAKGYSVVTISVAYAVPEWEELITVDFTDANWTAFSTTSTTASAITKNATIYAADGITPRVDIWNNSTQVRELSISPSSTGLVLKTTSTAASPSVKVVILDAAGQNIFYSLAWLQDVIKIEFLWESEEPAGSGAFAHLATFSRLPTNGANQHGYRIVENGSSIRTSRRSWTTTDVLATEATIAASPTRKCRVLWEGYITGSRTIESYGTSSTSLTDFAPIPRTGSYYMHQAVSQTLTTVPSTTSFIDTAQGGWGFLMYVDGTAVDDGITTLSRGTLKKIRISRFPSGALL